MSILQIGINPTKLNYPHPCDSSEIAFKVIRCGNKFCCIESDINKYQVDKINPLLVDEEILGNLDSRGDSIFTFVIGTSYLVDEHEKKLVSDDTDNNGVCDISKMHIWTKNAFSVQEINSKHTSIMLESDHNWNSIDRAFHDDVEIDSVIKTNGVIDKYYYAGEMKINLSQHKISINFLSGTFMMDIIDVSHVSDDIKKCITSFLQNKFRGWTIEIDETGQTYITQEMTTHMLDYYINHGVIRVKQFDTEEQAKKYANRKMTLVRIQMQINAEKQIIDRFKTDNTPRYLQLVEDYKKLENAPIEEYVPTTNLTKGGTKKYKRKQKKYRSHKKKRSQKKRRTYKKYFKKRY